MDIRYIRMMRKEWNIPGVRHWPSEEKILPVKRKTKLLGLFLIWMSSSIIAMVHVLELFKQNTLSSIVYGWAIIFLVVVAFSSLGRLVTQQPGTKR